MTFEETKDLVSRNQNLIGKEVGGLIIDDIVAYPINEKAHEEFARIYMNTFDSSAAIAPFKKMELGVYCILDRGRIQS